LAALETLELDQDKYKSYQQYNDVVFGKMKNWLRQIDKPEQLRELFWKCDSKWRAQPEAPQEHLQWIDPYAASLELIMYRLAEIKTSESAAVLVELYCDPKAGWDAGAALGAGDAVVKCGTIALPFLKNSIDKGLDTRRIIQLIESGATTGF
jgi:hypothetical protein